MKTNKKVLVLLLALAGAQSPVLAKESSNCKTFGDSPEITVCVNAKDPEDKLDREKYIQIKSVATDLLAKQKKALKNKKQPKAIMAPSTPLMTGTTVLTKKPVVMPYVETENHEEPSIEVLPNDKKYNEIPDDNYEDFGF